MATLLDNNDIYTIKDAENVLNAVTNAKHLSDRFLELKYNEGLRNQQSYVQATGDDDENIQSNETYSILRTYLAQNELDPLEPTFVPSSLSPTQREHAELLTACAMNDYYVGEYEKIFKEADFNVPFYGLSCIYLAGYDTDLQIPIPKNISPLSIMMDPNGTSDPETHRFLGNYAKYNLSEIMADKSFDHKEVEKMLKNAQNRPDDEQLWRELYLSRYAGFTVSADPQSDYLKIPLTNEQQSEIMLNQASGILHLIDMYIKLGNRKYLVTTNISCQYLLRIEPMKPLTKKEKKYPETIEYPFVFESFAAANSQNPWGINIFDISRSNAKNISEILNLAKDIIIKNKKAALLYRKGMADVDSLNYEKDGLIGVSTNQETLRFSLDDIAKFMPQQPVNLGEALAMTDRIKLSNELATGVGNRAIGIGESRNVSTLGQSRILNNNASVLFRKRLIDRSMYRKDFWRKIWLRSQQANITTGRKKLSTIGTGVTSEIEITAQDFGGDVPEIRVKSKLIAQDKGARKNQTILPMMNHLQLQLDTISFRRLLRSIFENTAEFSHDEIYNKIPMLNEERIIEQKLTLLVENIDVEVTNDVHPLLQLIHLVDIPTDAGLRYKAKLEAVTREITIEQRDQFQQGQTVENKEAAQAVGALEQPEVEEEVQQEQPVV